MEPLANLTAAIARQIAVVFTDIDDTLTTHGKLPPEAYAALWSLQEAGIAVVPVTGRPAGWCDHLARMWPVAGVIGENGAFYFRYDPQAKKLLARYLLTPAERGAIASRFGTLAQAILQAVPGAAVASDQPYRIHDLAIDFAEDVPPLAREEIDRIVSLFEAAGATAKVSSIHVNGWFGSYDKLTMIRTFAREVLGLDLDRAEERACAVYAGDSPNDEPAFAFFERSVGVANVGRFVDRMRHLPAFVTPSEGGRGFAELASHLLSARKF
jgi:HAD superfamily hydrolase (TIGR01484 family)